MTDQIFLFGKCEEVLKEYPDNHFDSVVTDAPYGLSKEPDAAMVLSAWMLGETVQIKGGGFIGKKWDEFVPQPPIWKEIFRVLKPGGHVLCFFGTRTYDWGVMAMRIAGFEIRDQVQWIYGSGFPKSMNIHKFMTKAEMEEAEDWIGWGTALKPASEPIVLARKPIELGLTIIQNIHKYGTGGVNIDVSRIPFLNEAYKASAVYGTGVDIRGGNYNGDSKTDERRNIPPDEKGRFPANIILDPEAAEELDCQTGELVSGKPTGTKAGNNNNVYGQYAGGIPVTGYGDSGGASRFFYVAKPSPSERNKGTKENFHPTVKPIKLMQYLVKMITPPHGKCLDPFAGSGTTGIACCMDEFNFIGIDEVESHVHLSNERLAAYRKNQLSLF